MSFRKRNIGISSPSGRIFPPALRASPGDAEPMSPTQNHTKAVAASLTIQGVRPSPLDGRLTTSTGTQSLDNLLAGHRGLALGCSVLLEETGTTDYAGTLLRHYAAEGVVQKHQVYVVGIGEQWGRELPGLVVSSHAKKGENTKSTEDKERMKIAWRYERLGDFTGESSGSRAGRSLSSLSMESQQLNESAVFCHTFDLTKRLILPSPTAIDFIPVRPVQGSPSPFPPIIKALSQRLSSSKPDIIHRLLIPTLLSPAFYPPHASSPKNILQFLHSLRALLRQYPTRLTVIVSLPLTLYPRSTGLVRWMELLSDGVIELVPFPHTMDSGPSLTTSGAATVEEEKPQGMIKIHRLPIFHEHGGGGSGGVGVGDDLAFTVSRRKFVIKPFSLPPVEGDTEVQKGAVESGKTTNVNLDF